MAEAIIVPTKRLRRVGRHLYRFERQGGQLVAILVKLRDSEPGGGPLFKEQS